MTIRIATLAAVSALALGLVACTPADQTQAEANTEAAADNTAEAAATAGTQIQEGAAAAGEVIEGGAMKAAQAVEAGAGNVADHLEANQAEAAAEGRPGATAPTPQQ